MSASAEIMAAAWVFALLPLRFCRANPVGMTVTRAAIEKAVAQPVQNLHCHQPHAQDQLNARIAAGVALVGVF